MVDAIFVLTSLVHSYGLTGLFISSLIGSTIFIPFSVEAMIGIVIGAGFDPYIIVLVAALGALIGTLFNYSLGYFASGYVKKYLGEQTILKAKNVMDKYGWPGLFAIIAIPLPLPVPVDPITIIPGLTRMNLMEFSAIVFTAKLFRYALFVGLCAGLLGIFGISAVF